jgi:lipid-binding SYLF domain-containing protein
MGQRSERSAPFQLPENWEVSTMSTRVRILGGILLLAAVLAQPLLHPVAAQAASAAEIRRGASAALKKLYAGTPKAKELADKAKGILVFPSVVKAGFMVGGRSAKGCS